MKIHFCGGADEVGASCILLEMENKNILLDCGMRMKKDPLPDFQTIKEKGRIDAVILSHAHMDHSGTLPILCSEFPYADVWMTPPTEAITKILLYDSLKIMDNEGEIPKYNKKQVETLLQNIKTSGFNCEFQPFASDDIKITFFPAGHILGAASVYIETPEGTIFYSGDISLTAQRTIGSFSVPKLRPDICIIESTYGNRMHSNRKSEEEKLINSITETLNSDGRILIPAFAVGRAQEVILTLRSAINRGIISNETKIYIDGMVRQICSIYKSFQNYLNESVAKKIWNGRDVFFSDNIMPINTNYERTKLLNNNSPCCIISSSGMLTGGPSSLYAEKIAGEENSLICITGYQDEESPGRKLQELCGSSNNNDEKKIWTVNNKNIHFKCKTGTYSLSAHADKNELINIVEYLKPKEVFLVHGNSASITSLGSEMQLRCSTYVHAPKLGDSFTFKKFHGKRYIKQMPEPLKYNLLPSNDEDLSKLSKYLLKQKLSGPWTVNELLQIWGIANPDSIIVSEMTALLNNSNCFRYDLKRLFLFYATEQEKHSENSSKIEVNQMLARAAELFPEHTGLYKKGARIETGIVILSFRYPSVAKEKYSRHFEVFEKETGWKVELNKHPDTSSLQPLLSKLLKENAHILGKISWHLDKNEVHAELSSTPEDINSISNIFYTKTHLKLIPVIPDSEVHNIVTQNNYPGGEPVYSQNQYSRENAVNMLKDVFEPANIEIFKYSIKKDSLGEYIELQFLTPKLGEKYNSWINDLKELTGWKIATSPNPRQQELIAITKSIASEYKIPILKGPSIHSSESKVSIKTSISLPQEIEVKINESFLEKTGFTLNIKY